jgi:prepilin-type N-terminal cleavage/methylation domain-containing protein
MKSFKKLILEKKGFTIVETLISIAIFGILMVGILAIFSGALAATAKAGRLDKGAADVAGELSQALNDAGYTADNISSVPATIVVTIPSGEVITLTVDKITGRAVTDDGLVVEFITYSQNTGD